MLPSVQVDAVGRAWCVAAPMSIVVSRRAKYQIGKLNVGGGLEDKMKELIDVMNDT